MNKEVKKKWIQALTDGSYRQTTQTLYNEEANAFCCLGVLTDLYIDQFGLRIGAVNYDALICDLSEDKFCQIPDKCVVDWAELTENQCIDLAGMNDAGNSFLKIAEHIERHY